MTQVQSMEKLKVHSDFEDSEEDDCKEIAKNFFNRKISRQAEAAPQIVKKQQSFFDQDEPTGEQVFQVSAIDHIVSFQDDSFENANSELQQR